MANPIFNLTGKKPADTYPNLVQFDTSSMNLVDGLGNSLSASTVQVTASYAATASYAFTQLGPEVSSSHALRADNSDNTISASFASTALVADSVATAGFANNATSASHALRANNADNAGNATSSSFASSALNADNATSASWAPYVDTGTTLYTGSTYEITSSWTNNVVSSSFAGTALNADNANSAGFATNAGFSTSGSSAGYANTSSWSDFANSAATSTIATSASWASQSLSSSWAPYVDTGTTLYTGSIYEITSSWTNNVDVSRIATSASWASSSFSSSYALRATDADISLTATSASHALQADSALVSNGAVSADTASYLNGTATSANLAYDIVGVINHTMSLEDTSTTTNNALLVQTVSGSNVIAQSGVYGPPDLAKAALSVARGWNFDFQPQTYPLLRLVNYGTGSADDAMWVDYYGNASDLRRVFRIDASGSVTAKSFSGTASLATNAVSASYAPTVTVGLTTTQSWWDAMTSTTQSMYLSNGLVVSWSVQA